MSAVEPLEIAERSRTANVADRLADYARRMPDAVAIACPGRGDVAGNHSYATCSFDELDRDATDLARGFIENGVERGTRLVLLVPPSIEFVKLVFALLRSGATTVLVDPGLGRQHVVNCLAAAEPEGFVAVSKAHAVRLMVKRKFPKARLNVTVGRRWFWGGPNLPELRTKGQHSAAILPKVDADDPAAIIFTSGSTGPPKGVLYTHRMFLTQAEEIRSAYEIQPGETDLACFALFGLFNSAMGVTTVFPRMNFARPSSADPRHLLAAANDWQVTQAFASPAVWRRLGDYCSEHRERIPSLRKVFSCGAPVPAAVSLQTLACIHPAAAMHTPYGATESLPVATIAAAEVLSETAVATDCGAGVCVGRKFDSIEWRVIRITDDPLPNLDAVETLPVGEVGELMVRGPQVTPGYVTGGDHHNALTQVADGDSHWHRLGDVGYLDDRGRFWYCGRKAHRVVTTEGTFYSICCEAILETHPEVTRAAVVGVGERPAQKLVAIIEPKPGASADLPGLKAELLALAARSQATRTIAHVLFHPSLPVDVRHNAKINREALAAWASRHSL